ncbi:MAG: single-stranded DNA-binding protein [Bacteroidota bacterium]
MGLNCTVNFTGNLVEDVKVQKLDSGKEMAVVWIATNDTWYDKASDSWRKKEPKYHNVLFFRSHMSTPVTSFKKGDWVQVLATISYKDLKKFDGYSEKVASFIGVSM